MRASTWFSFPLWFCLVQLPAIARAQSNANAREQHVAFDDDLLNADLVAPFGDAIFPSHLPPARTLLIRPRGTFVPELLASVERL